MDSDPRCRTQNFSRFPASPWSQTPLILLLLGAACASASTSTALRAADYDQSCVTNADCVVVAEGDVCACGCAPTAAINASDEPRYEADVKNRRSRCQGTCPGNGVCNAIRAACTAGKCVGIDCGGSCADAGRD